MITQFLRIGAALFFILAPFSKPALAQYATSSTPFASCNNLDFTSGTTGWQGRWCNTANPLNYNTPAASLPTGGINGSGSVNLFGYTHELVTAGMDAHAPISRVPPGHTAAIRLGDDKAFKVPPVIGAAYPYNHQMIRNTFTVTPENPGITYWYAVVFDQDLKMAHDEFDQPYFRIRLFDGRGIEVACASYDVNATTGAKGGFQTAPMDANTEAVYKDWVPIYIPLINYVNQQMTIQFESSDCSKGGHFGYAYIAVDCNPYAVITSTPFLCGTNTAVLTAPGGASTYKWTGPGIVPPDNGQSVTINKAGAYHVTMSVIGNSGVTCTFDLDTVIKGSPDAPTALYTNTTVCVGNPTVFTDATPSTGAGCASVASVNVVVNEVPTVNAGTATGVCPGNSVKLLGSFGGSATSVTWSGGKGTFADKNNPQTTYTPAEEEFAMGTITLTLTTNDPEGPCTPASSDVVVALYQNPTIKFSADKRKGCPVHCVNFSDSSTVTGGKVNQWKWDFGDPSSSANTSDLQNPRHCYENTGFYDVSLTVTSDRGCVSSWTYKQLIQVFAIPIAEFIPYPNPASMYNPKVTLKNASSPDVVYWNYHFGDGDSVAPKTISPIHLYPGIASRSYMATLHVRNADGCVNSVEHLIEIGPEFAFYIPNAFTPTRKDEINDTFFGKGVGIVQYHIWIFDRWGNMVFDTADINEGWDGRANDGKDVAQEDVFVDQSEKLGGEFNYA